MRNDLDLDIGPLRQRGDLDRGPCGKVRRKILCVHLIHAGEICQVRQENSAFDDIRERELLIVENRLNILQGPPGLRLDVSADKVAGCRVQWYLTGAEKEVANSYGVIIRADRGG